MDAKTLLPMTYRIRIIEIREKAEECKYHHAEGVTVYEQEINDLDIGKLAVFLNDRAPKSRWVAITPASTPAS